MEEIDCSSSSISPFSLKSMEIREIIYTHNNELKKIRNNFKRKKRISSIYQKINKKLDENKSSIWFDRFKRNLDPNILKEFFNIIEKKPNVEELYNFSNSNNRQKNFFQIAEKEFLLYHQLVDLENKSNQTKNTINNENNLY